MSGASISDDELDAECSDFFFLSLWTGVDELAVKA
jgi:hypothetical protein